MQSIKTYNNTKRELEIELARLELLRDKIELLNSRYFPVTSSVSESHGTGSNNDPYIEYLIKITKINPETGKSLDGQYKEQLKIVHSLEKALDIMTKNLSELEGVEHEIYFQVVVKGKNITKAINKVVEIYQDEVSESTVWRIYNKKIKKLFK